MRFVNLLYVFAVLAAVLLYSYVSSFNTQRVLFYGFTENKETEINLNHGVEVNEIFVTSGQFVKKGDVLMEVSNIQFEHDINHNEDRIEELKIKEKIWLAEREGQLAVLSAEEEVQIKEIDRQIQQLHSEKNYNSSLFDGLENVAASNEPQYDPIVGKIQALLQKKRLLQNALNTKIKTQKKELEIGNNPYRQQIRSLNSEIKLNEKRIDKLSITAPSDGLIGNIHCKQAEHISSFKTLITFYEPKPTLIRGYVHENLIVHVAVGDSFTVKASKDTKLSCEGKVVGLGSRIIEIPPRLRKIPDFKTYGREVLIKIPANNKFLQKEKVILYFEKEKERIIKDEIRRQQAHAKINE